MENTHPAVITMNQNWVIALIEDKSKDIHHHLCRDGLLLGTLHIDDILLDTIGPQEGRVGGIFNLSLNKSPTKPVSPPFPPMKN